MSKDTTSTATSPEEQISDPSGFWTPKKVRALIGLIIVMSFMLAAGFGLFIYKVTELLLTKSDDKAGQQAVTNRLVPVDPMLPTADINLNGFKVQHITANKDQIILHLKKKKIAEIWIYDLKASKLSKKIRLTR